MERSYLDKIAEENATHYEMLKSAENTVRELARVASALQVERSQILIDISTAEQQGGVRGFFAGRSAYRRLGASHTAKLLNIHQSAEADTAASIIELKSKGYYRAHSSTLFNAALIDADKDGVSITTTDEAALEKAQWQHAHLRYDDVPMSPLDTLRIDTLTEEELRTNAHSHPEFSWDVPEFEIEQAKEIIMSTPLTHVTVSRQFLDAIEKGDVANAQLSSYAQLSKRDLIDTYSGDGSEGERTKGLSFGLDIAMGLDKYVFMRYGMPYARYMHGELSSLILIDPGILRDNRALVTLSDIISVDIDDGSGVESDQQLDAVKAYRNSAILGSDWIEIMARRMAQHKIEHPDTPLYPIHTMLDEIKFFGSVPYEAILKVLPPDEIDAYIDSIASHFDVEHKQQG